MDGLPLVAPTMRWLRFQVRRRQIRLTWDEDELSSLDPRSEWGLSSQGSRGDWDWMGSELTPPQHERLSALTCAKRRILEMARLEDELPVAATTGTESSDG